MTETERVLGAVTDLDLRGVFPLVLVSEWLDSTVGVSQPGKASEIECDAGKGP